MTLFFDIGVLVLFAALAGVIAGRLKFPPVLMLLAVGAVIGPSVLGIVKADATLDAFAAIGAALLLFAIGAEFSLPKLARFGLKVLFMGLIKLAIAFWLSYELALLIGLDSVTSLYVGAMLAISSTALTVKILEQKRLASREEVPLLVAILVVEDIFAVFALAFFSDIGTTGFTAQSFAMSAIKALAVLGAAYFIILQVMKYALGWLLSHQSREVTLFAALGLAAFFAYIAETIGLTPSIGAFLAGSIVSSLPQGKTLEEAIAPFTLAFSSIFFVSVGMLVDFSTLGANWGIVLVLIIANLVFKFAGTAFSTYLFGFTSRSAVFSGIALLSLGEFSIIIATSAPKTGFGLVGLASIIVFTSVLAESVLISRSDAVYRVVKSLIPRRLQEHGRKLSRDYEEVVRVCRPGGELHCMISEVFNRTKLGLAVAALVLVVVYVLSLLLGSTTLTIAGAEVNAFAFVVVAGIAVIALLAGLMAFLVRDILAHSYLLNRSISLGTLPELLVVVFFTLLTPFVLPFFGLSFSLVQLVAVFILLLVGWEIMRREDKGKKEGLLFFKKHKGF